ncbi:MAG: NAD(+) diphosphatase [Hyphomicrobiaceae bacterium]|nr:NAD(+) diphosphatase [Hyphomicrobiaceae bacterium]
MPTLAATALLDRMSGKRADQAWVDAQKAAETARFLMLTDLKPVVVVASPDRTAALKWLTRAEVTRLGLPDEGALFLGVSRDKSIPHFAIALTEHQLRTIAGAAEMLRPAVDLRSLAMQGSLTPDEQSLAGKARALAQWHENARCCGKCGSTTLVKDGGWRRKCWGCGLDWFPRTDPVVIMLVTDGERCILAHEYRYANKMYSTLAGFLEPGEDIEHAVRREVLEEVNIKVGRVDYFRSQPWPFPHSLMLGCIAHAETTDITVDKAELAEARWFTREEAKAMLDGAHPEGLTAPGRHAIAHVLVKAFIEGKTG